MKILSIDFGGKRIGLAISDEEGKMARRFKTLENRGVDSLLIEIENIVYDEKIGEIIIGIPVGLKNETDQTREVKLFTEKLSKHIQTPIFSVNEVYTSKMAQKNLLDAGVKSKDMKEVIDQEAARIILQEYLDKKQK